MTESDRTAQLDMLKQQELQLVHQLGEVRGAMRVIQSLPAEPDPPKDESKQD